MILMQIWNSYEIWGEPDETLWFSSPERQQTYLKHFTINADGAPVKHLVTVLPIAFDLGAVPAGIDLDPEPPAVGHLYTATWDGMTATRTHDVQLIPISHVADHQPAEDPEYVSSAPRFRLTEIKWAHTVEGQYSKVTIVGIDQDAVTAAFDELIADLTNRNRLTDKETLEAIKSSEDDEYSTYFAPIIAGDSAMSASSFFGIDRMIAGEGFATRAKLRREYIAAQAQVRKEAGVSDSSYPDQVPHVFYSREELWADEAERMHKLSSVNAATAAVYGQAVATRAWPIPPVMAPPPISEHNAATQKPNPSRPLFSGPMFGPYNSPAPLGPPIGPSLLSSLPHGPMSSGSLHPGSTLSQTLASEVAQAAAAAANKFLTASPVSIAGQIAHQLRAQASIYEEEAVRAERREGASWTEIGDGLGIKKQGAHKRFRKLSTDPEPGADWRNEPGIEIRWQRMHEATRRGEVISSAEAQQVDAEYGRWRAANFFGVLSTDPGDPDTAGNSTC